jgi:hypothetical protein
VYLFRCFKANIFILKDTTMEKNKQIQIALVGVLALMVAGFLATGAFKGWFGRGEGDIIRSAASSLNSQSGMVNVPEGSASTSTSDNIDGMNKNVQPMPTGPTTIIKYDSEIHNFGSADEGDVVKHVFKFTNAGKEPLLISNAKGSCGCTVPTWPKEPVPPGGSGELAVEFNTKGKPGKQSKRITVTANTVPTETFLEIAGDVRSKEAPSAKGGN